MGKPKFAFGATLKIAERLENLPAAQRYEGPKTLHPIQPPFDDRSDSLAIDHDRADCSSNLAFVAEPQFQAVDDPLLKFFADQSQG